MKKAEDFRNAFGPADSGFESAVRNTLQALTEQEKRQGAVRRPRILIPAIAAILIMAISIGMAAGGHWGVLDWLRENRSDHTETTPLPAADETSGPFMGPVDSEYMTITVREARNDGYGMYLSVLFTPKEEGTLAYNWGVNPFRDSPEIMGIEPDQKEQTLAEWAVSHGYHRLIRIGLFSRGITFPEGTQTIEEMEAYLTEQGIPYKKANDGNIIPDRVSSAEDIDSYMNNTMVLEEDGSTLIMAAGGSIIGRKEFQLGWSAVPCLMKEDGTPNGGNADHLDLTAWTQGWIPLAVPDRETGEPQILAEYTGTAPPKADLGENMPVTVQLLRTDLNEYYVVRSADTARSFQAPCLYMEGTAQHTVESRFGYSGIHSFSVQERNGELLFADACRIPENLPDRLVIVWFDTDNNPHPEETLIERTDR